MAPTKAISQLHCVNHWIAVEVFELRQNLLSQLHLRQQVVGGALILREGTRGSGLKP